MLKFIFHVFELFINLLIFVFFLFHFLVSWLFKLLESIWFLKESFHITFINLWMSLNFVLTLFLYIISFLLDSLRVSFSSIWNFICSPLMFGFWIFFIMLLSVFLFLLVMMLFGLFTWTVRSFFLSQVHVLFPLWVFLTWMFFLRFMMLTLWFMVLLFFFLWFSILGGSRFIHFLNSIFYLWSQLFGLSLLKFFFKLLRICRWWFFELSSIFFF